MKEGLEISNVETIYETGNTMSIEKNFFQLM